MASIKQTDIVKAEAADAMKGQGVTTVEGLADSKMEPCHKINNGGTVMSDENDRNSVVSSTKSADPARKKMFKITSVKKGGNGDIGVDNDADSIDGLDESQTEDFSSEIYDCSKATDLDMDIQDYINIPLTPDEVTSTTTIMVKQKPDHNSQSRFKVVKIETKEPFRRGKWVCYDFYDTAPGTVVTVEKNGSSIAEDSIIHSALSDNHSFAGSVHYVHDVNDSSSNIFIPPVVPQSPARDDGQPIHSDVFVPIQPAPASQVLSQLDGLTSDVMAPFIAQQVLMSVGGVPSSSSSFHNLAQPGHTTIIQSLPHTNVFPFGQNVTPVGMFQNGIPSGQAAEALNVPTDNILTIVGNGAPAMMATTAPLAGNSNLAHSQAFPAVGGLPVPRSRSQTQVGGDTVVPQGVPLTAEAGLSPAAGAIHVPHNRTEAAAVGLDVDQIGPCMSESTESIKTLQGDVDVHPSESLKEAVDTVGEMCIGLEVNEDDADERNEILSVLSNLPIERPSTLPFHLHRGNVDSPFGFCLTPVGSLCASPVPLSFMEHYDPVSMAGIFPVRVVTPTLPPLVPPSTTMEPIYKPLSLPGSTTFPRADSFIPPSYFPVGQHVLFSSHSAFVPHGISETSSAPTSMRMGITSAAPTSASFSTSWSPTPLSMSTSQRSSPADRMYQMSSLSHEFPIMPAHKSASLVPPPSSLLMENYHHAAYDTAVDSREAANAVGYNRNPAGFGTGYTPTSESHADDNGGSSVAIDNKIEQAMLANLMEVNGNHENVDANHDDVDVNHNNEDTKRPQTPSSPNPLDNDILKRFTPGLSAFGDYVDLVKRHLMYAVREEVEILKQQIGEMMERIGQLEYENTILRSEAKPETLNKLQQPRASQTSQTVLPGQNASIMSGQNMQQAQQTTPLPVSQNQPSQPAVQPTSQQQASQSPIFQAGQSPL